ncbi:MAG: SIR2 family protein [Oscillospiraceae bacterium]|nr:SIR2 family protein [Oscillospiraceae bacterium]
MNDYYGLDSLEKQKQRVKKYLELENVSVLTGAGTSFHLGAPIIRTLRDDLKTQYVNEISQYFPSGSNPSFEDLINCLQADRYLREKKGDAIDDINTIISEMQNWLFEKVDTQKTNIQKDYQKDVNLEKNRYYYHEMLIKKLLQRPNNLKRANLFTTNYDMAFDYALDNLGVHYINGFTGVHNRCFRPEVYDYDLYYPGESVTGKVHRAERVLKYYKLHGSLSWLSTVPTVSNTYGIKEIPLNDEFITDDNKELVIYPCVSKKSFTLDLPYSELFRHFAQAINKPQSVLICLGYSFFDEHINDIINQALSLPSFTLIVANYTPPPGKNTEIDKLIELADKRIEVLNQEDANISSFAKFVSNVMPDLYEEEEKEAIALTMKKLYPNGESISFPPFDTPENTEVGGR